MSNTNQPAAAKSTPRTVLVTGGAKRIGKHYVEQLAADGHCIVLHCNRSRGDADALAASLTADGAQVAVVQGDLSDLEAVEGLMAAARAAFGPIDLLINNASVFEEDELESLTQASWLQHMNANLAAPLFLARDMANALPAGRDGLIINMIDQRVWKLTPQFFSYTLSKSALWTATQTMAQALAPRIRVVGIGPGPTLQNSRQDQSDFQQQLDSVPLKRGAELGEFSATVRYLLEARSITGQMIALDGGQHLVWQTPDIFGIKE